MIIRSKFNGYSPDGQRLYFKGGGGGSVKYDNLERLYEIQAQQAESLMTQANENVYPNYNLLMDEAKGFGSIANQEKAAGRARGDVLSAQIGAKKQLEQQLSSMGVNPNDQKFANTLASMDLEAAAQSAAAQTGARDKTRDMGFARLTDTVNAGMGIGSNAVAALNSAGGMAGNIAGLQHQAANQSAQNSANIAALGTRLLMKSGGLVPHKTQRFASGGRVQPVGGITGAMQSIQPPAPPASAPAPSKAGAITNSLVQGGIGKMATSGSVGGGVSGLGSAVEGVGNLVGKVAPEAGNAIQSFGTGLRLGKDASAAVDAYNTAAAATEAGTAAAGATEAAAATAGAAEAATAAGAKAAGTTATAMGAGSAIGGALAAAMPWVGGALLVGSALDLFADGGEVKSHKIGGAQAGDGVAENEAGGRVDGPGGPKDDKVNARLSPGEFVMPVGAVKLYGIKELEKMRARGLRYEKQMGIA